LKGGIEVAEKIIVAIIVIMIVVAIVLFYFRRKRLQAELTKMVQTVEADIKSAQDKARNAVSDIGKTIDGAKK
jgi:type II secretory pathway pseudopilin PulG